MRDVLSLQVRHQKLHAAFSENQAAIRSDTFRSELNHLINEICQLSEDSESMADYLWLRTILEQWRTASSLTGIDVDAVLKPPSPNHWRRQMASDQLVWSDGNLKEWLNRKAHTISRVRALEWHSQLPTEEVFRRYINEKPEEANRLGNDWDQAELFLAAEFIDGRLDLATSIGPDSYWRLEGIDGRRWVRAVKQLKAYLRWRDRGGGWCDALKTDDYLVVCGEIRAAVTDRGRKAPQSAFGPIQRHIQREFLGHDGKLDIRKDRTQRWLRAKTDVFPAYSQTGANIVMKGFYENISTAVLGADLDATARVLESLGLRRGLEFNEQMVNCFEMTVAICFLDVELAAITLNS